MNKYAALAAIAALALTGCAATSAQATTTPTMTEHVQDRWQGTDVPAADRIETLVALVCKGIRTDHEVVVLKPGENAAANHALLEDVALKYGCA